MTGLYSRYLMRGFLCIKGRSLNIEAPLCAIHATPVTQFRGKKFIKRAIQPYDWYEDWSLTAFRRWFKKAKVNQLKDDHSYKPARFAMLGPDLASAHFVVARGGAVKFEGDEQWVHTYESNEPGFVALPGFYIQNMYIEAINWSGGPLIYESLENFACLEKLKYLNISNSANVDDWCLDRFHMFPHLLHLDISGCDKITERGLACLHKLKSLQYLNVSNMNGVTQKPLVAIMLEEMLPNCHVEGLEYIGMENYEWETDTHIPVYLLEEGEPKDSTKEQSNSLPQTVIHT